MPDSKQGGSPVGYIGTDPDADLDTSVGHGQAVAYVKKAAKTPVSTAGGRYTSPPGFSGRCDTD
jgi:hypothetical protein